MPDPSAVGGRGRAGGEAATLTVAMVAFALFAHQGGAWVAASAGGLLAAAVVIGQSLRGAERPAELLGVEARSGRVAGIAVVGGVAGLFFGVFHRWYLGLTLLPGGTMESFAALAGVIGATEEVIYRGWLQGRLRVFGWPVAVAGAALAHAAYKTALFAWSAEAAGVDLFVLGWWTATVGLVFGALREWSRSLGPPLLAHAVFDLVTYGAVAHAPWWVWS